MVINDNCQQLFFILLLTINNMRNTLLISLFVLFLLPRSAAAQNDDDIFEANRLKKTFPDDRVAAIIVEEEFSFDQLFSTAGTIQHSVL
jgi:hypothetical protein